MLLDKNTLMADDLAYNGTVTVLDLRAAGAGRGEPVRCFFQGHSLTEAIGGNITGFKIQTGATSSPATDLLTITATMAQLNAGVQFLLPQTLLLRYIKPVFTGTGPNGGTFSCGVVLDTQTAT